jgi:hypothetical protein
VSAQLARGRSFDDIRRYAAVKRGEVDPGAKMPADAPTVYMPPNQSEVDQIVEARSQAMELEDAKLRRVRAMAEGSEIENMVRRGELLPVHYVEKWLTRYLIDARDELLRLPSELGDAVAGENDPVKARAILAAGVDRVIKKFDMVRNLWQNDAEAKVA